MTTIFGVDASYDSLSPAEAAQLKAAGVEVFWQCLWTGAEQPPPRIENLRTAKNAGLTIMGYISVAPHHDGRWHAEQGRAGVPGDIWDALVLVPTDVELNGIPNQMIRDCVERIVEMGKRRAIYTSYGHWTSAQGNTRTFIDCLLINAFWDDNPDVDFPAFRYGGWQDNQVVGEQFTGGHVYAGVFVDRDVFVKELLLPATSSPPPVSTPLPPQTLEGVRNELLGLIGNLLQLGARHGELINALGTGLAAVAQTVTALQTGSGDVNNTTAARLNVMEDAVEKVTADLEAFKTDAKKAAKIILEG